MSDSGEPNDERLIILVLAAISLTCIVGIIVLQVAKDGPNSEALVTIASLAAGALASRISQKGREGVAGSPGKSGRDYVEVHDTVEDEFAVIGRAATKTMIEQALRNLGQQSSAPAPQVPTN